MWTNETLKRFLMMVIGFCLGVATCAFATSIRGGTDPVLAMVTVLMFVSSAFAFFIVFLGKG